MTGEQLQLLMTLKKVDHCFKAYELLESVLASTSTTTKEGRAKIQYHQDLAAHYEYQAQAEVAAILASVEGFDRTTLQIACTEEAGFIPMSQPISARAVAMETRRKEPEPVQPTQPLKIIFDFLPFQGTN